ncbi:N-acetylmuramic acid 6-phosphate etherase [Haloactinopolyspora alba]|uniref:N-acetylmuramic acid 6-phosphate etherase n=1 Tax=Haloactinopolyspora alba TaxID=648780 RepID=A0A2P8DZB2_9ACTN|nr:N-acetylmuramic acid 6-phosphate etherase [Haloactinopolyspora alba]PSL02517.1 N-acetylmuramic acid 6-phosphate etherase [Haloactinopolyspora alba]
MNAELDALPTEGRLPGAQRLDLLPVREQVALMARQNQVAVDAVAAAGDRIVPAIEAAVARMRRGGRLIEVGAGTPGRLAVLDVAECGPTFGVDDSRVMAVMAGGSGAVRSAAESDEDSHQGGRDDLLAREPGPDDVVVAVSASGRTPYVLGAVKVASEAGALTVGVVNNEGSAIAAACDLAIEVPTGPEVVSGSTRLKAGTAEKLVLNTISTLVMVGLGHTYGDLMIDVRATNGKLRRRAERIVRAATGASEADVTEALRASGDETKTATVMLLTGVDADEARRRLSVGDGHVRRAADRP